MTSGSRVGAWVGRALSVAALLFVASRLWGGVGTLASLPWKLDLLISAIVVVGAHLLAVGTHAVLWSSCLALVGTPRSTRWAFHVLARTNLAKYIPGNIFHYVGRASMASDDGISLRDLSRSVALETIVAAGVSVLLGASSVAMVVERSDVLWTGGAPLPGTATIGLTAALAACATVLLLRRLATPLATTRHSLATLARATSSSLVGYLATGVAGFWFASVIGAVRFDFGQAVGFVSASALAWLLGFVVPGAPGGFGIREAVLMIYLQSTGVEASVAALVSLALRLLSIVGDLLARGVAHATTPVPIRRST